MFDLKLTNISISHPLEVLTNISIFHPLEVLKLTNISIFHPLKVVGRGSETQLQVGENLNDQF